LNLTSNNSESAAGPDSGFADIPSMPRRTRFSWVFRRIRNYLGALIALILIGALLATMYFTWFTMQWVTLLSGILGASVLSLVSRSVRAEWLIARRTAQLSVTREKLARETRVRLRAEQAAAGVTANLRYLDETLPATLAYIDGERHVTYHNRAFRHWLGSQAGPIDGRHLSDVLGASVYADVDMDVSAAFSGHVVHRERTLRSTTGESFRMLMQFLPQYGESGVVGIFMLMTDITVPRDVAVVEEPAPVPVPLPAAAPAAFAPAAVAVIAPAAIPALDFFAPTPPPMPAPMPGAAAPMADVLTLRLPDPAPENAPEEQYLDDETERLRHAIEHNEFSQYFQKIKPLSNTALQVPFCELLLRLKEEEESKTPPGAFLPLAEELGLMPRLDRWVVSHLLEWVAADMSRSRALYSLNLAPQTVVDPHYAGFVQQQLLTNRLPGTMLCFEFAETDVTAHWDLVTKLIGRLKGFGGQIAISGFGRNPITFELLKKLPVDYVKIDGSLILSMFRSPVELARVKAIHQLAHSLNIRTIAENVEDARTIKALLSLGIDHAQGFAVSRPKHLDELQTLPSLEYVPQESADADARAA